MKAIWLVIITCLMGNIVLGQDEFGKALFDNYNQYVAQNIAYQYLKREDIAPIIEKLKNEKLFEVSKLGESVEGREVNLIKCGTGPVKILLWSQMHGNEPTATMALMDIFRFLTASDSFDEIRQTILSNTTLYFVPMLNPDGAERFERRNALNVDLNRDALRLQSPESNILKNIRDEIEADFGFNLHDQSTLYSAGVSAEQASISFLAPAYNWEKEVNKSRENAMKVIVQMNRVLQQFIPNKVGKYNDTFEPRAFGDNIQKWGTSTILIETGGYPNDVEKQFLRKMNFIGMLTSLKSIAEKSYVHESIADYYAIPDNKRYLFDLIIRNAQVDFFGKLYTMDIGINRTRRYEGDNKTTQYQGYIAEFGDMSTFFGYKEFDASGMTAQPGKVGTKPIQLDLKQVKELHKEGILAVPIGADYESSFTSFPINFYKGIAPEFKVRLGASANFSLVKEGEVQAVVVNGFLQGINTKESSIGNGVVLIGKE